MSVRKTIFLFVLCFAFLFSGCQIGTDEHQFTTLDRDYVTSGEVPEQEDSGTDAVTKEPDAVESQQETKAPSAKTDKSSSKKSTDKSKKARKNETDSSEKKKESFQKEASSASKSAQEKKKKNHSAEKKKQKKDTLKHTEKKESSRSDRKKRTSKTKKAEPKYTTAAQEQKKTQGPVGREEKKEDEATDKKEERPSCFIFIECTSVLANMTDLRESKKSFVPADGVVLQKTEVPFEKGETVYDVLYRVCREKKIHLESKYTPVYQTYYVEGIHQLYEFDCGNLSGWVYFVNGVKPNYGCSGYKVSQGDVIQWSYTCHAGKDVTGK